MTALFLHQMNELFTPSTSVGLPLFHADLSDRIWQIPVAMGQGFVREIELSRGLSLVIVDCELTQAIEQNVALFRPSLEFEFCLVGNNSGSNLTMLHLGDRKRLQLPSGQRHLWVEVFVTTPRLESYFSGLLEQLSPNLRQLAKRYFEPLECSGLDNSLLHRQGATLPMLHDSELSRLSSSEPMPEADGEAELWLEFEPVLSGRSTVAMQNILNQLLDCPYQGISRQLYLESKALELITLRLEQIAAQNQPLASAKILSAEDTKKIYQAREILRQQLKQPPSLIALARQVGLNDCTLKRGFRQVFGMTAFECLYHDRMQQAQQLLETSDMAIKQVAAAVGYTSRSSFYTAFRKQFGVGPHEYLMQRRKNSV
ncbi:helix-turn-helix transcriptional regulator [Pantanalinema sp. GBBB05]|uniref:helix-turn-helix transcriptional regulator n=1 Tax=Pantanalinema sp. GBBB05 TaxID=2604139 RepID=UPI001DE3CD77|nr:helix-turn-helix transcriptional regulator [Pantanalinema sp. GBBB05]